MSRTDALLTMFDSLNIAVRQLLRHPHKPGARILLRQQLDEAEATVKATRAECAAERAAPAEAQDPRPEPPPHSEPDRAEARPAAEDVAAEAPRYYWQEP